MAVRNDGIGYESRGQLVPSRSRFLPKSARWHRSARPGSLPASPSSMPRFPPRFRQATGPRVCAPFLRYEMRAPIHLRCSGYTWKPWLGPPPNLPLGLLIGSWLFERRVNFLQQCVAPYWLTQKTGGPGIHHQIAKGGIAVRGDENDGDLAVGVEQVSLQLNATHPRQAHVQDQARRISPAGG